MGCGRQPLTSVGQPISRAGSNWSTGTRHQQPKCRPCAISVFASWLALCSLSGTHCASSRGRGSSIANHQNHGGKLATWRSLEDKHMFFGCATQLPVSARPPHVSTVLCRLMCVGVGVCLCVCACVCVCVCSCLASSSKVGVALCVCVCVCVCQRPSQARLTSGVAEGYVQSGAIRGCLIDCT